MNWKTINERYVQPAKSAQSSGRMEEAEAIFKEGLQATGNDGFVALTYAEFLEESQRFEEAKEKFHLALRRLPKPEFQRKAREGLDRVTAKLPSTGVPRSEVVEPERGAEPTVTGLEKTGPGFQPLPAEKDKGPIPAPRKIALISCIKQKKTYPCTARELYSESKKFRKHLAFAEAHYDRTYVISARHDDAHINRPTFSQINWPIHSQVI